MRSKRKLPEKIRLGLFKCCAEDCGKADIRKISGEIPEMGEYCDECSQPVNITEIKTYTIQKK